MQKSAKALNRTYEKANDIIKPNSPINDALYFINYKYKITKGLLIIFSQKIEHYRNIFRMLIKREPA